MGLGDLCEGDVAADREDLGFYGVFGASGHDALAPVLQTFIPCLQYTFVLEARITWTAVRASLRV